MTGSHIRAALESLSDTIAAQPEKARAKHGSATATTEAEQHSPVGCTVQRAPAHVLDVSVV
jgi:hypothetical protein